MTQIIIRSTRLADSTLKDKQVLYVKAGVPLEDIVETMTRLGMPPTGWQTDEKAFTAEIDDGLLCPRGKPMTLDDLHDYLIHGPVSGPIAEEVVATEKALAS